MTFKQLKDILDEISELRSYGYGTKSRDFKTLTEKAKVKFSAINGRELVDIDLVSPVFDKNGTIIEVLFEEHK